MEYRDLTAFIALANELHFGRASEQLHMTPSTLSRLIRRIEDELGTPLFIRDRRKVELTFAGERFLEYATEAAHDWQKLKVDLTHPDDLDIAGELSLFCSVTASYSVLADILPKVREFYPKIEIQLRTGDQADSLKRVVTGNDDLAIAALPTELPSGVKFQSITQSSLVMIAPTAQSDVSSYIDKALNIQEMPDWSSLPFVVANQGVARQRVEQWWRDLRISPKIYASITGHEAVVTMVALGFGVALVPRIVVDNSPLQSRLRVLDIDQNLEPIDIGLCALSSKLDRPALKALWGVVEKLEL